MWHSARKYQYFLIIESVIVQTTVQDIISIVDKIWINYSATFLMLSVKENRGSCIFEYLLIIIRILIEWFFDSILLK